MAKARSRRTMRNRKSRNRRGGVFRFFISDDKKAFKDAQDKCNYIVELVNKSPEKIPSLYNELNEHDKNTLRACIVTGLINDKIVEKNIRDLSLTSNEKKEAIINEANQIKANQQAQQKEQAPQEERAPQEQQEERAPQASDNVFRPNIPPGGPGGFYKPKPTKPLPTNVEAFQEQLANQDPLQPQNAGKSRRRHRRGHTLHKIRKSRKVRKTRCRRGRM